MTGARAATATGRPLRFPTWGTILDQVAGNKPDAREL